MSEQPSNRLGSEACAIAGQDSGLPRQPLRRWSRRQVIQAINQRARSGQCLKHTWRQDRPLFRAAANHFGNWTKAMLAAGQTPLVREYWTQARVIERLQVFQERCGNIDVRQVEPRLASAALRLFGSIETARQVAGVEPPPRRWTRQRVIETIQDRYISRCTTSQVGLGDHRLYLASQRLFGSWELALAAAGLSERVPVGRRQRKWSQDSVVCELQRWHQSGRPLSDVSKLDQGLYCAAKTHFGMWRAALLAAGLEPACRLWSKQVVIEEIRLRIDQHRSLSSYHPENRNLAAVAVRQFGSWLKAIQVARQQAHSAAREEV
jgi:hypothetical protein